MKKVLNDLENIRSAWRRALVSFLLDLFVLAGRFLKLRPADLALPAILAQIVLLAWLINLPSQQMLIRFAVGNMVLAGVAMLPSVFLRNRYRAHWVKGEMKHQHPHVFVNPLPHRRP